MKRRNFLIGLLGIAAIPFVGLPTPKPISLMEAALKNREKLIAGVIEQLTSVNSMNRVFDYDET